MNYPSKQALYCYSKVYDLDLTNVHTWGRAILAKEMGQINTERPVLPAAFCPEDVISLRLPEVQTYSDFDGKLAEEAAEIMEALFDWEERHSIFLERRETKEEPESLSPGDENVVRVEYWEDWEKTTLRRSWNKLGNLDSRGNSMDKMRLEWRRYLDWLEISAWVAMRWMG